MKLKSLSSNLILLLQEILSNQELCKLIEHNTSNPYTEQDIETNQLMLKKVFPFPFNEEVKTQEGTQLRVYYPDIQIKGNQVIEKPLIFFDIICSKSNDIWLINDGQPKIRPYEIASELITHLSDRSIGTLGKVKFNRIPHVYINEKFDCVRVIGEIMTIGK